MRTINADPQTKQEWRELLDYLYYYWVKTKHPVTFYPPCYVRGSLRLDGVIGGKRIGSIVH